MLAGLGTDVVDIVRMEHELGREDHGFRDAVFLPGEVRSAGGGPRAARTLAGCFAAKEALFKALGTGWLGGVGFHDVEVVRDARGLPALSLSGRTREEVAQRSVRRVHLSLAQSPRFAMATVILES